MTVIDEYETLYRETRSPLYAWEALAHSKRGEPLPNWLWDYLVGAARSMHALGQPAWDDVPPDQIASRHLGLLDVADRAAEGSMGANEAAGLLARALGLQRGSNYNAFTELALLCRGFREAWHLDVTRAGTKQEAARAEIESGLAARNKGRKATSFTSQINRRIKRARKLWRAQRDQSDASA
jgi:hypothetical protein